MPIWKQGGKEDNTVQFLKVGRKKLALVVFLNL